PSLRGDMTWYFNDVTSSTANYSGLSVTVDSNGIARFGMVSVGTAPVTPSKVSFAAQRGNYGLGTEVAYIDDVNSVFTIASGGNINGSFFTGKSGSDNFIAMGTTEVATASADDGHWTQYKVNAGDFYTDVRSTKTHHWRVNATDVMTLSASTLNILNSAALV